MIGKRTTVLIFAALVFGGVVHAQVVAPDAASENALRRSLFGLGVFGGPAGGLGISFRHHLPAAFSYQVTGGIINVDDKLNYDIGVEAQYDLVRGPSGRFFAAGAGSYFYSGTDGVNQMKGPGRFGLGVGGEAFIGAGFHAAAELLFTYFTDDTVLPLPQFGIYYYFY
ncbi:MAG: hypothetical protein H6Q30_2375 [Bacteroidetes bacterium]|jgi:hypothetical protein|nr:hypothetical protein [Bacteroidota bacterium]